MIRRVQALLKSAAAAMALLAFSAATPAADEPLVFGLLMVGPHNDHGWSQAHYEGGRYAERKLAGARMIYIDKVNPADRPGVTVPMLVDDLVDKGARLIIGNSDDMKDGMREAATQHPDTLFLHISGDDVLTGKAPPNLSNLMGRMEYAKMMAGFSAALATENGKIAYLGPLINEETRRLAVAAYLGARHAWTQVRKQPLEKLNFKIAWIGFWFNIPGVTADPTQVVRNFFDTGYDVVLSGIDTTEALVVAQQKRQEGKSVHAIPYDYVGSCETAPDACLGVPYFNWGPDYLRLLRSAADGSWKQTWEWSGPDWQDINNADSSAIGFASGPAMKSDHLALLQDFTKQLGSGELKLFSGPLSYQDGSTYLKPGEVASDQQIWYMEQLLQGMEGASK